MKGVELTAQETPLFLLDCWLLWSQCLLRRVGYDDRALPHLAAPSVVWAALADVKMIMVTRAVYYIQYWS